MICCRQIRYIMICLTCENLCRASPRPHTPESGVSTPASLPRGVRARSHRHRRLVQYPPGDTAGQRVRCARSGKANGARSSPKRKQSIENSTASKRYCFGCVSSRGPPLSGMKSARTFVIPHVLCCVLYSGVPSMSRMEASCGTLTISARIVGTPSLRLLLCYGAHSVWLAGMPAGNSKYTYQVYRHSPPQLTPPPTPPGSAACGVVASAAPLGTIYTYISTALVV